MGSQLLRTLRSLAILFVLISGLGAFLEDKGLGKGMLQQPDMRPQIDGKTKFNDVKGVDEAKVRFVFYKTVFVLKDCQSKQRKCLAFFHQYPEGSVEGSLFELAKPNIKIQRGIVIG